MYHYLNHLARTDAHRLPDVDVFYRNLPHDGGWYWALGVPGNPWDSEPVGPFDSELAALTDAREFAFPSEPVHPLDRFLGLAPKEEPL